MNIIFYYIIIIVYFSDNDYQNRLWEGADTKNNCQKAFFMEMSFSKTK